MACWYGFDSFGQDPVLDSYENSYENSWSADTLSSSQSAMLQGVTASCVEHKIFSCQYADERWTSVTYSTVGVTAPATGSRG